MKYFVFNCSRLSLFEYVLAQSCMILLLKIILLISVLFLMVCLYYEFFDEGANRNTMFTCLILALFSISFLATGRIAVSTVKSNIKADIFSINSVSIKKPANLNGDFIVYSKKTKHQIARIKVNSISQLTVRSNRQDVSDYLLLVHTLSKKDQSASNCFLFKHDDFFVAEYSVNSKQSFLTVKNQKVHYIGHSDKFAQDNQPIFFS